MFPGLVRTFHEVVRAGSIRRAGDQLGVSPSSISRQVAVLERQMGTKLFERTAGGIRLTYAGEMVAAFSRETVMNFDSLKADLNDFKGRKRREIKVAVVESVVSSIATSAVVSFRQKYDEIYFRITMMPATAVLEAIRGDDVDVGITMSPHADPDIKSLARSSEPVVAVIRPDDSLSDEESLSIEQICRRRIAVPDLDFGVRKMFDAAVYDRNLTALPAFVANSFEAIRNYVRQSGDVGILPLRAATDAMKPSLRAVPIDDDALRQGEIHVVARRQRRLPSITTSFVTELVNAMAGHPI